MTSADAILIIGDRDPERLERSWSYPPTNFHRKTIAICMGVSEGEAEVLTQQDIPMVDRIFPHDHRMFGDKLHLHPQHVRYSHYLGGTTSAGNRSPVKPLLLALSLVVVMVVYLVTSPLVHSVLAFGISLLLAFILHTAAKLALGNLARRRVLSSKLDQLQAKSQIVSDLSFRGRYVEIDAQDTDYLHVARVLGLIGRYNDLVEARGVTAEDRNKMFSMISSSLMLHNSMLILEDHLSASQEMLDRTNDGDERDRVMDQVDRARTRLSREMSDLGLGDMESLMLRMEGNG